MTFPYKGNCIILAIVLLALTSCKRKLKLYDGFETNELSKICSSKKLVAHALEIQSAIVHSGRSAAKITLQTGDMYDGGNDSSKVSERDELLEAKEFESAEDQKYQYAFSLFIPDSFPVVPTRLIIAQWKQKCEQANCEDRNPVIAIRYESGKLFVTLQTVATKQILYQTEENVKNKWLDFDFKIKFARNTNGEINAVLNGDKIIDFKGVTAYSEQYGFPTKSNFYFKMGLYRDRMKEPMTIFIDEYRKEKLSE